MNLNLDFTYVNPAIKTTFGYTTTEWIGSNLQDHCDKYNFEMMAQIIVEELEKGTDHSGVIFEATMLKKNGDAIPVEIHGQILFDESGEPFSLQGITRDITERREAEAALRTSEKRLRAALDASPFPIVLVDANDDIVHYWSRSAQDLFGHTAPTAAEWYELAYPDPDYRAQVIERWKPCLDIARESGQPVNTGEYRVTCKDGTVRLCEIYATFITEGLVVSFNDITETRMSQEKEATLQAQLNQAQKIESIGRLAGGVAHDFNNMLSVILGHAEMALDQIEESSPLSNDLIEIQSAAKRSAELTRQLLAFARRQTISPKNLDLNATVESMLRMLGRLIGEDIDLSWLPGKNLHTVKMDPTQLDQLLANLCVNARDAIEGVGKVTIETCNVSFDQNYCNDHLGFKPGEYVCLSVSDNGCGMDKDTCANVFEPFFTTKKTGEGTGLGLATVYGIVKQNYGFINVYSEPGEGTTFRIYLPRHDSLAQNIDDSKKDVIKEGSGETILLVEDEAAIMRMGKAMLEKLGYKVLPSDNPMDALTIAQEYPGEIHALITDVVMPEMNGRNLAKRLQSSNPALKVLYMSGYTANVIAHHGTLDHGVHFLQKPFSKAQIASAIKRVLEPENE